MKNMSPILLAGVLAGWFATTASAAAGAAPDAPPLQVEQPAPPAAPAARVPRVSNADAVSGTADQGLKLNLRGVTVDQALSFLSESVGFTINRQTSTSVAGTVDIVSDTPLSKEDILAVFNKVLAEHDLTAIADKKTLTIETLDAAALNADTQVNVATNGYQDIPSDSQVVTEVIPVHTLNPKQVVTDLYTLIPASAKMNTSDAGTSVIMTGRQADIRRFAQIINALDSTGTGDLEVFLLNYADSKALAAELKDIFTDNSSGAQGQAGNPFAAIMGAGRGGRGGGGAGGTDASRRTPVHVNAVSDDQNNAVLVSAPADFMPGISNVIMKLDIPQEDQVQIHIFFLTNADCSEVANELLSLFPDPNLSQNQNGGRRGTATFGGRGGGGGAGAAGTGMSDRLKKQVTVNAVPDPRTQSVLVTASKDTMDQIEKIINSMDENPAGHVAIFYFKPQFGDVLDFVGPMQDLFQQPNGRTSSSTSTQQNALQQRMTTFSQQQGIGAQTTIGSSSGSGGRSGP